MCVGGAAQVTYLQYLTILTFDFMHSWYFTHHSINHHHPSVWKKTPKTHNSNFVPTSKKVGFFVPVARICSPRGTFSDRGTLRSKCRGQKKFPEGCNSGHRDEIIRLFEMEVWTLFFAQWVKIKAYLNFSWRKMAGLGRQISRSSCNTAFKRPICYMQKVGGNGWWLLIV